VRGVKGVKPSKHETFSEYYMCGGTSKTGEHRFDEIPIDQTPLDDVSH